MGFAHFDGLLAVGGFVDDGVACLGSGFQQGPNAGAGGWVVVGDEKTIRLFVLFIAVLSRCVHMGYVKENGRLPHQLRSGLLFSKMVSVVNGRLHQIEQVLQQMLEVNRLNLLALN